MEGNRYIVSGNDISYIDEEFNFTDNLTTVVSYNSEHALACAWARWPALNVFLCVFYLMVFLLAMAGNLVVGWVVLSSRHRLSPSDLFLFHLALADLLLAVTLPLSAANSLWGWLFGNALCKLVKMALEVNFYASVLFLVCISADRYMVVLHAAKETKISQQGRNIRSWVTCSVVWGLGLILSLPVTVYSHVLPSKDRDRKIQCYEHYDMSNADQWQFAMRILSHLLGFFLPLVAMLGFYSVTVARLLRTRSLRKYRAMRVIVAVVVAFLICWCPYHMTMIVDMLLRANLVEAKCWRKHEVDLALQVTHSLGVLHCCVNPGLYAFVGEKFRANLWRLIRKVWERESVSRYSRSTSTTSQDGNNALM